MGSESDDNCNTGLGLSLIITGSESEAHQEINKRKYSIVTSLKYDHLSPSDLTLGPISTPSSDDHDRKCSPDHMSVSSFSNSWASAAVVKWDKDVISGEEVETSGSVQMSTRVIIGNINNNNNTEDDDQDYQGSSRKKLRLTKQQSSLLEDSFKDHSTLNPKQKQELAKRLNLRPRQVEVWFQNRRARTKLKQTEADLEKLKKCCESLTEENKRVHKELKELKSLKLIKDYSSPFYTPFATSPPSTATLTICPSCERIGGSPRSAKPLHHLISATSFATSTNHAC